VRSVITARCWLAVTRGGLARDAWDDEIKVLGVPAGTELPATQTLTTANAWSLLEGEEDMDADLPYRAHHTAADGDLLSELYPWLSPGAADEAAVDSPLRQSATDEQHAGDALTVELEVAEVAGSVRVRLVCHHGGEGGAATLSAAACGAAACGAAPAVGHGHEEPQLEYEEELDDGDWEALAD
jgi:hypothetical protein